MYAMDRNANGKIFKEKKTHLNEPKAHFLYIFFGFWINSCPNTVRMFTYMNVCIYEGV